MDDILLVLLIKAESHRRYKGEQRLSFDPHALPRTYINTSMRSEFESLGI